MVLPYALHTVTECSVCTPYWIRMASGVFVMYRAPLLICRYLDEEIGVISRWNHNSFLCTEYSVHLYRLQSIKYQVPSINKQNIMIQTSLENIYKQTNKEQQTNDCGKSHCLIISSYLSCHFADVCDVSSVCARLLTSEEYPVQSCMTR